MPHFMLSGHSGTRYSLSSGNVETIGRWFSEIVNRFAEESDPKFRLTYVLEIYALHDKNGNADYCVNSTHTWCHGITFDGTMQNLLEAISSAIEKDD